MRLRKLALAVGLAGTLGANLASALGLGEITLHSTLNQPLDAHIRLLQVRDLSAEEVLVNLASREDFTRAGVDRFFFLTDLSFRVDLENKAGPVIKITSSKPVREPYLNFLVESQWPSGRLLREYTLLMDLPSFSDQAVRAIEGAKASSAPARSTRPRARTEARAPAPRRESQRARYENDVYGPVGASDTLWEIALKVRPDTSISVQQTMLAIQRQNPEAFINGNINLLKRGSVLRVPSADQITDISRRQAVSEVAQQNNSWSGDSGSDVGAQLDGASRRSAPRQEIASGQGRVKLASPSSGSSLGSGQGASGDADALENELAISLEELDKSKRENLELSSRVAELEAQLGTMERLVNVSNTELKTLQLALKQSREQAKAAAEAGADKDGSAVSDTAALTETPASESTDISSSVDDSVVTDPLAVAIDSTVVAEPEPKVVPVKSNVKRVISKPKEPGLVDMIMDNILLVAGALFAIVAAVVLMLRRKEEEPVEDELEEFDEDQLFDDAETDETAADELTEDSDVEGGLDLENDEDEVTESAGQAIEAETDDVVGEADIYIAYGKFDQAEEMLRNYLESDPGNTAARLKLMEVYTETNNLEAFDAQYRQVLNLDDELAAERAAELRASFSGAPGFDPDVVATIDANDMDLPDDIELAESSEETLVDLDFEQEEIEVEPLASEESDSESEIEPLAIEESESESEVESPASEESDTESDDDGGLSLSEGLALGAGLSAANELLTDGETATDLEETEEALEFDGLDLGDLEIAEDNGEDDGFTLDLDLSEELSDVNEGEELTLELDELEEPKLDTELEFQLDELETETEGEDESLELSDEAINFALDTDLDLDTSSENALSPGLTPNDEEEEDDFDMGDLDLDLDALDAEIEELSSEETTALDIGGDEFSLDDEGSLDDAVEELATLDSDIEALESEVFATELDADAVAETLEDASLELELEAEADAETLEEASVELELDVRDIEAEVFDTLPDVKDDKALSLSGDTGESDDTDMEGELDFLSDADEVTTKLDLARAYIDMGDAEGAKDILDEVIEEGTDEQRSDAEGLLAKL